MANFSPRKYIGFTGVFFKPRQVKNLKNHRQEILEYIRSLKLISTHSHHLDDSLYDDMSLNRLLNSSYTNWGGPPPSYNNRPAFEAYINKFKCNSFFRWLSQALEDIYGYELSAENAPLLDKAIRKAHNENPNFHLKLMKDNCRFLLAINDRQPKPGSDLGHPDFFKPSFRCDAFFSAYLKDKPDPNDFYAYSLFENKNPGDLPEFLEQVRLAIKNKKNEGRVALKVAIAYERPLNFENTDFDKAGKAINNPNASEDEIRDFGDALMFELAKYAAEFSLPLQIHTGLGQGKKTRPAHLQKLIDENPDTKFHLLHGGYPWFDDCYALLVNFKNVFVDTCWIPYLSTHAASRFYIEALENSDAHRLTWGDDAWMAEDSLGAVLAMEESLATALACMTESGAADLNYAFYLAKRILFDNAVNLFNLKI